MTDKKTAIVLLNLGGPLKEADIEPFLFNFFMDKNIIGLPRPLRDILAKYISVKRGRGAARESYAHLNFKSPLLENTKAQAAALEQITGTKVFVAMRYWHPRADETARQVADWGADEVVLLPLYPQFSTTTVRSSFQDWDRAARAAGLDLPTRKICCYPVNDGFVAASAENIRTALAKAPEKTRLLFSAHGLPEKIIKGGDPYQHQCEKTAEKIVEKLGIVDLDWQICYQSRVGPLKWIGPSTEEAITQAGKDGVGVVIYPHAFVSEHVETLVELDIEYRHLAEELHLPYYAKAETVGTHPDFIKGLAGLVLQPSPPFCPPDFSQCHCRQQERA